LASKGVTIIACPTCGRLEVDLFKIAGEMEEKLKDVKEPMTLALMGCAVNGPGEATHADMGIAFGKGGGLIYKDGKKLEKVKEEDSVSRLLEIIKKKQKENKKKG
jgi:(E)-4-hydroxy-3-methylbut-2-enyl-diphosphate synthase